MTVNPLDLVSCLGKNDDDDPHAYGCVVLRAAAATAAPTKKAASRRPFSCGFGAGNETRTRDPNLGKAKILA
jgi:hypothetical protein